MKWEYQNKHVAWLGSCFTVLHVMMCVCWQKWSTSVHLLLQELEAATLQAAPSAVEKGRKLEQLQLKLTHPVAALVKKGRDCVTTVRIALQQILQGKPEVASKQLVSLTKDENELTKHTQILVKRYKLVELHYRKEEEEIMQKIGEFGRREKDLQGRKMNAEATLASKTSVLQDCRYQVELARSYLRSAENRLDEDKFSQIQTTVGGAIVGSVAGFLVGGPVGVAIGASIGGVGTLAVYQGYVNNARSTVGRCESEYQTAQSSLTQSENEVQAIQGEINSLGPQIREQEQKRLQSHKKMDEVKEVIAFLKKVTQFWELFADASKHGVSRSDLLKKIVDKAAEKEDLSILTHGGTQRVVGTFMEAWERVLAMADEGAANFTFQIEFQCFRCQQKRTALPYMQDNSFICTDCFEAVRANETPPLHVVRLCRVPTSLSRLHF